MSYDPTQQPDSGYGTPPQDSYGAPQNPYGTPAQDPYGAPPYTPLPQDVPAYQQQGYAPAALTPLPLGEAIRQLPSQYIKVLTKPSPRTFAEEQGKAAWNIVWVQLLGLGIISTVLGYLVYLINPSTSTSTTGSTGISPGLLQSFVLGATLSQIVLVPVFFFIFVGIVYLIAKAFGGQGTFLAQGYTYLLLHVPITIISTIVTVIPILGGFASSALFIYAIVLEIFSIMAVHRFRGGKATLVVFLPVIVLFVLIIVFAIIFGRHIG